MNAEQLIEQARTTAARLFDEPGAEGKGKDHEIELLRTRLREVVAVVNNFSVRGFFGSKENPVAIIDPDLDKRATAAAVAAGFIAGTTIP